MPEDQPPDRAPTSPKAKTDHAPSSNKRRKEALRAKRRRRAERAARTPPRDERAEADAKLRAVRRGTRNHLETIRRMSEGERFDVPRLSYLDLVQEILHEARGRRAHTAALDLVHACLGTNLLSDNPGPARERIRNAFVHLASRRQGWIRRPHDWRPTRRNRETQLSELIRHLVAAYPLPHCFDEAWTWPIDGPQVRKAQRYQRWFFHVASGKNLRTAPDLPFELTKRVAHHTLEAGDELGIGQALRFGQARALGLGERVAQSFGLTRAGDVIDAPGGEQDNAFWVSVLRFLAPHGMLDPGCVGPVVDYLIDQRYVPVRHRDGTMRPVRPNLSMQGRTLEALLEQTGAWHREIGKIERGHARSWAPLGILIPEGVAYGSPGRFLWRTGSKKNPTTWAVVELLTSRELALEGRAHGHCVYSYAWSCVQGRSSIWSVGRERDGVEERLVTLEIRPSSRTIVQALGGRNRHPQPSEWAVIQRFATAGGLVLPAHLRGLEAG